MFGIGYLWSMVLELSCRKPTTLLHFFVSNVGTYVTVRFCVDGDFFTSFNLCFTWCVNVREILRWTIPWKEVHSIPICSVFFNLWHGIQRRLIKIFNIFKHFNLLWFVRCVLCFYTSLFILRNWNTRRYNTVEKFE